MTPAHPLPALPGPQLGCCLREHPKQGAEARLHATAHSLATEVSGTDKSLPSRSRTPRAHLQAGKKTTSRSHEPFICITEKDRLDMWGGKYVGIKIHTLPLIVLGMFRNKSIGGRDIRVVSNPAANWQDRHSRSQVPVCN